MAGLTNRPSPGGRDPTKRSRGELPLVLAGQRTAETGVHELVRSVQPGQYNPAWLLVGDRESLFYIELAPDQPPSISQLPPGVHILENVGLGEPSPKVDRVHSLLEGAGAAAPPLWTLLPSVLADHTIPRSADESKSGCRRTADEAVPRLPATLASCVHTEEYGTRSAALVRVASDPAGVRSCGWPTVHRAPPLSWRRPSTDEHGGAASDPCGRLGGRRAALLGADAPDGRACLLPRDR